MSSVIHEIRNQLAVAVANVEAFRDGVLQPTPERLGAVLQALAAATALLRDLPAADRAAAFASEPRRIDACDIIAKAVLSFESLAAGKSIDFVVHQSTVHDEACPAFFGDPVRVAQIVGNILSNAIRYTPSGGRVEVDCRRVGGSLAITVTDDGPGIRSDEIGKIFDDGFRGLAAARTEGSGLGLGLAARFVHAHGGSIAVNTMPGHGARFTVRLPGERRAVGGATPSASARG